MSDADSERFLTLSDHIVNTLKKAVLRIVDKDEISINDEFVMGSLFYLEERISSIEKNLDFLKEASELKTQDVAEYVGRYIPIAKNINGKIRINNLNDSREFQIEDIYVEPLIELKETLKFAIDTVEDNYKYLSLGDALVLPNRSDKKRNITRFATSMSFAEATMAVNTQNINPYVVVLGNPGGGKTSFAKKKFFDLCNEHETKSPSPINTIPFFITLRNYAIDLEENQSSIIEYIESHSNSHYHLKPEKGVIEYLLHNGMATVIFDGLDELLETSNRTKMVEIIEAFRLRYPSTRILITSREVGYSQASMGKKFRTFQIKDFDDEQVEEYANKFFKLDESISNSEAQTLISKFLHESRSAEDIRQNPLMLGLLCSLYKYEQYIPQNRPQLYERCSEMLFEKWDSSRGIDVGISFRPHLMNGLMFLANWIFTNEKLQSGVRKEKLINKTTEYLDDFYPNINEAETAAREFVDFCKGRAWVFTDVGDDTYRFTHQTFLEYFTAKFLARKHNDAKEVVGIIKKKIINAEWEVVNQLLVHITSRNIEGAADKIIISLLNDIDDFYVSEQFSILRFIGKSLEFLQPSKIPLEVLVRKSIHSVLSAIGENKRNSISYGQIETIFPLDGHFLISKNDNNFSLIKSLLDKHILNSIQAYSDKKKLSKLIEIIGVMQLMGFNLTHLSKGTNKVVIDEVSKRKGECFESDLLNYRVGQLSFKKMIQKHGIKTIFFPSLGRLGEFYSEPPRLVESMRDRQWLYLLHPNFDIPVLSKRIGKEKGILNSEFSIDWKSSVPFTWTEPYLMSIFGELLGADYYNVPNITYLELIIMCVYTDTALHIADDNLNETIINSESTFRFLYLSKLKKKMNTRLDWLKDTFADEPNKLDFFQTWIKGKVSLVNTEE